MKYTGAVLGVIFFVLPLAASAATTFEVTGWIPYWRSATGTADVLPHLDDVTEVNPFVYTLKSDGTLLDNGKLTDEPWLSFIAAAKAKKVRVIPTVMTGNSDLLHRILSSSQKRVALEETIAAVVKANNFDGIDIDFEGKKAADKDNFSTFLKGLRDRLGSKWLMCTIESRTPLESRYYGTDIPPDATIYANDFKAINAYCDRVRVMTYDQQNVDQKLASEAASSSQIYAPVADPVWVEKVINLMSRDIAKSKLLIGVPTYGYEYSVTAYANNQYVYDILWTFNPRYATDLATQMKITPLRNTAGEMYFTYIPNAASSTLPLSVNVSANLAAVAISQYVTQNNSHADFRLVDWPDATSIAQKIALAKKLGVRGISIFKWDGGEAPGMWSTLAGVASDPVSEPPRLPANALARTLVLGSSGEDVRTLQRILNSDPTTQVAASGAGSSGYETTKVGPATVAAIKKFQVKYGIANAGQGGYGTVGPATRAKLNAILAAL